MNKLISEVLAAADQVGCNTVALTQTESKKVIDDIRQKYSNGLKSDYFWETLKNRTSLQNREAWSWIKDFVKDNQTIMFFINSESHAGVLFENGDCVVKTLWECTGFEFYLTNLQTDYLLCFNHHDFLIGAGTAQNWVMEKQTEFCAAASI